MQEKKKPAVCAWCGDKITDRDGSYGLITKFRKKIRLGEREEKRVAISLAHLDRPIFGFVRRREGTSSGAPLDLTFKTCSQGCAHVLHSTLQFERRLFSVPLMG